MVPFNIAARLLDPFGGYRRSIGPDLEPAYIDDEVAGDQVNSARGLIRGGRGRVSIGSKSARQPRDSRNLPTAAIKVLVTHHPFDVPRGVSSQDLIVGRASITIQRFPRRPPRTSFSPDICTSVMSDIVYRRSLQHCRPFGPGRTGRHTVDTRTRRAQYVQRAAHQPPGNLAIERYSWETGRPGFDQSFAGTFRHTAEEGGAA